MMAMLSPQALEALAQVVTGGAGGAVDPPPGAYRSGGGIVEFFERLGLSIVIGSRVPSVRDLLQELSDAARDDKVRDIVAAVLDPRDYIECEDERPAVVEYLNKRFKFDGWELQPYGDSWQLVQLGRKGSPAIAMKELVDYTDYDSVSQDFGRALRAADTDPPDSVTAACSTVESVCKCLLDEMGLPYPAKQDIKGLVTEVGKHLNLSPARKDLPAEFEQDIRQILGGLVSVTRGIGALRTHAGDAHGRGKARVGVDARIARLAIHAASTVSLFFIETWQRRKEHVGQQAQQ